MKTAVLGLGNILFTDEGVGVHAAVMVKERFVFDPAIEIVDGGTMGLDLMPLFHEHDRMLIIDAVDFGQEPGFMKFLENDEIPDTLDLKFSVHHIGLKDVLFAAKITEILPQQVSLLGIQPASLETGMELSPVLSAIVPEIIHSVITKLKSWGIRCEPADPEVTPDA